MRFVHPEYIFIVISIIGFLAAFYFWVLKIRRRDLEKFAQKELLVEILSSLSLKKKRLKVAMLFAVIVLCFFSLLRPQWGFRWEEVKRKGLDILIALDTSKSMLAEDVKPNRLQRSKLAIRDLLKDIKGDRLGLVAFAGSAFLQCPLTIDYNGFLLSLNSLDTDTIPRGGTSISSAIREAVKSYEGGQKKYKVLIIITDGEDHEGDSVKGAQEAKKEGIVIFCIGIGTKEGDLLLVIDETTGQKAFLKDKEGNVVKSRMDETALQKIALETGGVYVRATNTGFGLDLIYRERLARMEKRELLGKMNKHYDERFQIFLVIALILLLGEMFINERK
ncbi:MAG: VWA domain-containing protein [Candidatus Omnitrophica bacterium]|nr:VWA domain-containing protein [Candidatus Omnitrophota bacterium]